MNDRRCACGRELEPGYNTWCKACSALPRDGHGFPLRALRSYIIQVVPSRRGWLATCNGEQISIDGRQHNPGLAAIAMAEKLWPKRQTTIHQIARTTRYTVDVADQPQAGRDCRSSAPAPQDASRTHAPASAAPNLQDVTA